MQTHEIHNDNDRNTNISFLHPDTDISDIMDTKKINPFIKERKRKVNQKRSTDIKTDRWEIASSLLPEVPSKIITDLELPF